MAKPKRQPTPSNKPPQRVPGHNVDRIDVAAGLRELTVCGYEDPHTVMVIEHALMRWGRGEEAAAQLGAIDKDFFGISLTCWMRVLAAARAHGEAAAEDAAKAAKPLRRYTVSVARDIQHRAEVEVEARDEDHAKKLAAKEYDGVGSQDYWREGDVIDETVVIKETK